MYRRPQKIDQSLNLRSQCKEEPNENKLTDVNSQFEVLWRRKSTKKHKTWEGDGIGTLVEGRFNISSDGFRITSANVPYVSPGQLIVAGQYEIEVSAPIQNKAHTTKSQASSKKNSDDLVDFLKSSPPVSKKMSTIDHNNHGHLELASSSVKRRKTSSRLPSKGFHEVLHSTTKKTARSDVENDDHGEKIEPSLYPQLQRHQIEAASFLYDCVTGRRHLYGYGAILADDMGLGKTLVAITLIYTLLRQDLIKNALVVCPVTLLSNWKNEFRKWLGERKIGVLVCNNDTDCTTFFKTNFKTYQVLIVGYERMRQVSNRLEPTPSRFDLVVCDEGHKMKAQNSKAAAAISDVVGDRRVILTGTPVQNNLGEFWSLADFVNPGCLGTFPRFCRIFAEPINAANRKNSSGAIVSLGKERMEELLEVTGEFMIRRDSSVLEQYLSGDHKEYVIFCWPTKQQLQMYKSILENINLASTCHVQSQALGTLAELRKVSNSCALVDSTRSSSGKINFFELLISSIREATDEKVVVVSGSTKMLDMCQQSVANMRMPWVRLDGDTPQEKRQGTVNLFNRCDRSRVFVFLLSVRSGGVGLNLTGASRLIMMDCDWNPSVDLQAIARIRRQGQTRPTFIYRLMSTGLIDEKIWQRQLSKSSLSGAVFEGVAQKDEFTLEQLKDLFSVDPTQKCNTLDIGKAIGYMETIEPEFMLKTALAKQPQLVSCILERC